MTGVVITLMLIMAHGALSIVLFTIPKRAAVFYRFHLPSFLVVRKGLRERGYTEGDNIRIEHRFAEGRWSAYPRWSESWRSSRDIFVAGAEPIVRIRMQVSATTPIVLVAMGFDPSVFELIVNQRTARALGIAIPRSILLQADEVIG